MHFCLFITSIRCQNLRLLMVMLICLKKQLFDNVGQLSILFPVARFMLHPKTKLNKLIHSLDESMNPVAVCLLIKEKYTYSNTWR